MQFVIALIGTRLLTTLLPPDEVGRIALITAITAFFAMFLVNPVGMYINRHLHEWAEKGQIKFYFSIYWKYLLLVCAAAGSICYILNYFELISVHTKKFWLLTLICGSLLFNTVNQTVIPSLNMLGYRNVFILLTLATLITGLISAFGLTQAMQATAEYWLLGLLIGQAVFGWLGIKILYKRVAIAIPFALGNHDQLVAQLWRYAWPVALAVGLGWVQMQGYRFILEKQVGLAILGLYFAGYGLSASLLTAFEMILTTYFQPLLYKRVSMQGVMFDAQAWNDYASAILPALIFVTAAICIASKEITAVMLGSSYQDAGRYVLLGALAEATRVLVGMVGLVAHLRLKTHWLLFPNFIGVLITIGLIVFLVPVFGSGSAAVSVALGGAFVAVTMYFFMRQKVLRLPWIKVLQALFMAGIVYLCSTVIRHLLGENSDVFHALLFLGILGILSLPMLYILLRSHIKA
ncbi:lipopolysaccharide biosynthesis protein [Janthinobacterium sp. DSP2-3-3]|uniref:lipopolysaccharide biosynthesis protein n=1 Tax=Janthinobacterium sp. DSP2-3-3 TaxID=2804596 RepID=UPI003CF44C8A